MMAEWTNEQTVLAVAESAKLIATLIAQVISGVASGRASDSSLNEKLKAVLQLLRSDEDHADAAFAEAIATENALVAARVPPAAPLTVSPAPPAPIAAGVWKLIPMSHIELIEALLSADVPNNTATAAASADPDADGNDG